MPNIRRASLIMFYCVLGLRKQCLNLVKVCFFSPVIFSHDAPHLLKRVFIFFPSFFCARSCSSSSQLKHDGKIHLETGLHHEIQLEKHRSWLPGLLGFQSEGAHLFWNLRVKQGDSYEREQLQKPRLLCVHEQFSKQLTVIDSLAAAASSSWSLHHLWSLCTQVERSGRRSRTWY